MKELSKQEIGDFLDALVITTEDAQDSLDRHLIATAGIQFFSRMAFEVAPSEESAREVIDISVEFARQGLVQKEG
tara:strand:- start:689 stop:913 length:225 start_codon:yes stop_codon:yes gene_type:complete